MAVPQLRKEYLDMIPEFNGEPELLSRFLEVTDKLVAQFANLDNLNDFQNEYLMSTIRSKIKGEAAVAVATSNITTWANLRECLINAYGDKRDVLTLCEQMHNAKQGNDNVFDFFKSIQKQLNLMIAYNATHVPQNQQLILNNFLRSMALRRLLRGLNEPLSSLIRTRNPTSLNEALGMLTNDFQLIIQNQGNQKRTFSKFKPQRNIHQINNNRIVPSNYQPNPHYFPRTFNNNYANKYNNTFNRNVNTNRPFKPTPMSISTKNTNNPSKPHKFNRTNHFKPSGRPHDFITEELFNMNMEESESNNSDDNFLEVVASEQPQPSTSGMSNRN